MTVVPLEADHLDAIAVLEEQAGDVRWTRAQFARELELPFSCFRVGLEKNQVIGYGGFWAVAGEAQITNLVIAPDFRRQGLGRQLIEGLLQFARDRGCTWVTLEVRENNPAAQGLYRKMGFKATGRRPAAYEHPTDAAVLMEKLL